MLQYFLQALGHYSVEQATLLVAALVFLYGCYKKVEKYFKDKTMREIDKEKQLKDVMEQVGQYPKWHEQSIDIRNQLNDTIKELNAKMDAVTLEIQNLRKENGADKASTCRYRVLRFDDEIRHGVKHTKEHFDQILDDIEGYEHYCEENPEYKNNKAVLAIENVRRVYRECRDNGSFL